MRSKETQSGFTLIEVLVALILSAVTVAAIVSFVVNSSATSASEAAVAAQNSKLRSTMALVQRELGDADEILEADVSKKTTSRLAGNSIAFKRIQETGSTVKRFTVERISYNGPLASTYSGSTDSSTPQTAGDLTTAPKFANTITVQIYNCSVPSGQSVPDNTSCGLTQAYSANPKVLLDDVPYLGKTGTNLDPLFVYNKSASTVLTESDMTNPTDPTDPNWYPKIQLVDVNLYRDEDIKIGAKDADITSALSNEKFPTSPLKSSVYLKKLGEHTESSGGGDVEC